tara:strand:+ start:359 stop:586 length:228 start_codon:yes stop_codon:yes gene_type:complete
MSYSTIEEKLDNLTDVMDELLTTCEKVEEDIKGLQDTMTKLWRAEDMEENDGKFRWPFDEHGNVMDNVNISRRLN